METEVIVHRINGGVYLEIVGGLPVPVEDGERFPARWLPQSAGGDPPTLQIVCRAAGDAPAPAPATAD